VLGLPTFPVTPTNVAPNTTTAALGAPSTRKFNGLLTLADTLHHLPKHAVPGTWTSLPAPLASAGMPTISDIAVLNRRDALIVYVPAVKGAADYRAYLYDASKVTFKSTPNGTQPRGAVLACAGYRQRFERNIDALQSGTAEFLPVVHRELIQAIEVPGLVADGNYKVVVEALASPCPFPGVMGHTDASIPLAEGGAQSVRSFNDVKALYGNEILNGQGSSLADYTTRSARADTPRPAEPVGQPVPPNDPNIPADPVVLARSAIAVTRPAADEATNGPIFDVGSNAVFDDFGSDGIMSSFKTESRSEGAGLVSGGQFGDWFFWTIAVQQAISASGGYENGNDPKGVQVWRRHGRLYTTFGDWAQDVLGAVYFTSTKTLPQQLDASKYVHSLFRIDSGASQRRYWHWFMCGGATREELVDPVTRIPRARPVAQPFFYLPAGPKLDYGFNPTAPVLGEAKTQYHDKECLNLIQLGSGWNWGAPGGYAKTTWFDEPHSELHAFINPAGVEHGIINLKPAGWNDGDVDGGSGMPWRVNAQKQATQPMFEPFDQQAPLTHFDVFVRPDRVVFYINGRQSFCSDLSDRPLTMKYGLIGYGNVLYHSSAEITTNYVGQVQDQKAVGGSFHYVMNTPFTDTRIWDAVGHSEKIDIPTPQFTFDPALCFKPQSIAVR
jgi:hypothetical protein